MTRCRPACHGYARPASKSRAPKESKKRYKKTVQQLPKNDQISARVEMVGRVVDCEQSGDFLEALKLAREYKFDAVTIRRLEKML